MKRQDQKEYYSKTPFIMYLTEESAKKALPSLITTSSYLLSSFMKHRKNLI